MPPPIFYRKYAPPFFDGSFFQYSWVGYAWLKVSLVLQHIIYHPQKVECSCSQKNGRAVKFIYSHNFFSTFATKI